MLPLKKIALLIPVETPDMLEAVQRFKVVAQRFGVLARSFNKSDDLIGFEPDCILAFSCQDAKLTPYPTYGVLMSPVEHYLRTRRFVRNVLTYDAYLTLSPKVKTWLKDITFGVRKFSSPVAEFAATVQSTDFVSPPMDSAKLVHVGANREPKRWMALLLDLVRDGSLEIYGPPGAWSLLPASAYRGPVAIDGESVLRVYRAAGIGLDLPPTDAPADSFPSTRILEIVAASAVAITARHPFLEAVFGDTLLYFDIDSSLAETARQIRSHLVWICNHPKQAIDLARDAHRIFCEKFALDRFFPALLELHSRVLVEKGYQPSPDPESEANLPSVTYIMRTGGGRPLHLLRRALDSLVSQRYPKLSALFVLFREMPEVDMLRREYPSLNIEVVEDFGGLRSTAICAGMRHVRSDLFGLLDDDDYLHPNHVRMLVKALNYHNGRNWRGPTGMAYSGSVEVSDAEPRCEQNEYEDAYALTRRELRCLEHYRVYNSAAMSEHRWYLINTWLVRRSLIDEELLSDPKIHTCEDLYVALQLAQRTFLAFSGEVTTVHFFGQHGNSTRQDSGRHFSDTLRIAIRMWSRQFPFETVSLPGFMPLGREFKLLPDVLPGPGVNILGRLNVPEKARKPGGRIDLTDDYNMPNEVETAPLDLEPDLYALNLQFEASLHGQLGRTWLEIEMLHGTDDKYAILAHATYRREALDRHGDLLHANLLFEIAPGHPGSKTRFRIRRTVGLDLTSHKLMVIRGGGSA